MPELGWHVLPHPNYSTELTQQQEQHRKNIGNWSVGSPPHHRDIHMTMHHHIHLTLHCSKKKTGKNWD